MLESTILRVLQFARTRYTPFDKQQEYSAYRFVEQLYTHLLSSDHEIIPFTPKDIQRTLGIQNTIDRIDPPQPGRRGNEKRLVLHGRPFRSAPWKKATTTSPDGIDEVFSSELTRDSSQGPERIDVHFGRDYATVNYEQCDPVYILRPFRRLCAQFTPRQDGLEIEITEDGTEVGGHETSITATIDEKGRILGRETRRTPSYYAGYKSTPQN